LGTAGPQGGSGAWVTGGPGWWDGTQNVLWTGTSDDAVFAAPGGTVAIAGGVLAGSLTFNSPGYVVTGGSVSLTAGGGLVANADAIVTGPGTWNLAGDITFNSTPLFETPSARLSASTQLSAGQHALDNPNGNLSTDFYDLVIDGAIGGPGGLTKTGNFFAA